MRSPTLHLHRKIWKVLQRTVRGHGSNSRHRLPLRTSRLWRSRALDHATNNFVSTHRLRRPPVKAHTKLPVVFLLLALGIFGGCSGASSKSPDVTDTIRRSLDQASLKDVSVSQDRDKGVVKIGGHVESDAAKSQAESIARS